MCPPSPTGRNKALLQVRAVWWYKALHSPRQKLLKRNLRLKKKKKEVALFFFFFNTGLKKNKTQMYLSANNVNLFIYINTLLLLLEVLVKPS